MSTEWIGVVKTTAPQFFQGAADMTIRKRLLLAMLAKYGRYIFNCGGESNTWDIEYAQQAVQQYGDLGVVTFNRSDLYKQLTVDWRGYLSTDMMSEKERRMNSSPLQIIDRYARILPTLRKSLTSKFNGEFFINGNTAGNENRIHGMQSFGGTGTTVAADRVAQPSTMYGGLSTAVQAQGGTWSSTLGTSPNAAIATDWPDGNGTSEYDCNTPTLPNWSSTNWGTGSTSWEDNCERVFTQTTIWLSMRGGDDAMPTMYLCSGNLYYPYKTHMQAKQRIIVPHKEAEDLGFGDVMNQDGVMITSDFDVPVNQFYGINVNQMELAILGSNELFETNGPDYDPKTLAYLFSAGFFGNARYSPKYFAIGQNYA